MHSSPFFVDDGDEEFLPFDSVKSNFNDATEVMMASAISVTSSAESTAESLFCSSTASVLVEPGKVVNSQRAFHFY